MFFFLQIFTFFSDFFAGGSEKNIIDTNNKAAQLVQSVVDKNEIFSFPFMIFVFHNFLLIAKKLDVLR